MKPEQKLTIRYADLLTEASDEALGQLVQELDTAYTAPERPAGLSWETVKPLTSQPTLGAKTGLLIQPLRLRRQRGRKKVLLAVAAVVVMAFLSAILLTALGGAWSKQNHQTQLATSISTVRTATDLLLLQQLLQSAGTPANIRQLAQSSQFTEIHLSLHTGNVMIQEVYADGNNVVVVYTVDWNTLKKAASCDGSPSNSTHCQYEGLLTITTSEKQTLKDHAERYMGKEPIEKGQRVAVLAYYDASSIQGNPKQLHLTASLSKKVSHPQGEIGVFTVPFHADKTIIAVNQTATSHSDALTLEQVVITSTEIRFDNRGLSSKPRALLHPVTLSIASKSYASNPFPSDTFGWFSALNDHSVSFYDSLQSQTGTWILTEGGWVWTSTSLQDYHTDT